MQCRPILCDVRQDRPSPTGACDDIMIRNLSRKNSGAFPRRQRCGVASWLLSGSGQALLD